MLLAYPLQFTVYEDRVPAIGKGPAREQSMANVASLNRRDAPMANIALDSRSQDRDVVSRALDKLSETRSGENQRSCHVEIGVTASRYVHDCIYDPGLRVGRKL